MEEIEEEKEEEEVNGCRNGGREEAGSGTEFGRVAALKLAVSVGMQAVVSFTCIRYYCTLVLGGWSSSLGLRKGGEREPLDLMDQGTSDPLT